MPERPRQLHGFALREWNRVAKPLFSMGRLQRQHVSILEVYCTSVADFTGARNELQSFGDVSDVEKAKFLRPFRSECRADALQFGFPIDVDCRMDISKPLPLKVAARRLQPRRQRDRESQKVSDSPDPPKWFNDHMRKVWERTAAELIAKGRLRTQRDEDELQKYAYHFGKFFDDQLNIKRTRIFERLTGTKEIKLIEDFNKSARFHWDGAKRSAVTLGFFLQSPRRRKLLKNKDG